MLAIRLVFRNPWNAVLFAVTFMAMSVFYLWSSQVLTIDARGISIVMEPLFAAAALVVAFLFALVLPLEIHAFRLAIAGAAQAGSTVLGALLGTASMTCCAPVVLPSILSLLGVSGANILSVNLILNRFWLPLATLSIVLLSFTLISVAHSLTFECRLQASEEARPR
jgi:hypothetical protein